jgi:hypothetical protein
MNDETPLARGAPPNSNTAKSNTARRTQRYISIRDWRSFQHYDPAKRIPPWIKQYTELLHNDAYMNLPLGTALLLHRLWLEYASSRCRLALDTGSLSRRLGLRVTKQQLKTLNRAGFIDIVASAALADGYHDATQEKEKEKEKEKESPKPPYQENPQNHSQTNGKGDVEHVAQLIRNGGFQMTDGSLHDEFQERQVSDEDQQQLWELVHELRDAA